MKKETPEALEAYKIRIDALEIVNEAYRTKIEALEMLNRNLQFLRDAQSQVQSTQRQVAKPNGEQVTSNNTESGSKRGRGRPRKSGTEERLPKTVSAGKKRGRKPKGYIAEAATPAMAVGEKKGRGRPKKFNAPVAKAKALKTVTAKAASASAEAKKGKKAKSTSITRLQVPLEARLRETLADEGYNKATFRALTGILLCLFENGIATVTNLHEYIGGSRVTVVRHTATLKKLNMLTYEGSRKKGHYELTAQGRKLYDSLANA